MRKILLIFILSLIATFNITDARTRQDDVIYFYNYQSVYETDLKTKVDFSKIAAFDVEGNKLKLEINESKVNYDKAGHYQVTLKATDTYGSSLTKTVNVIVNKGQTQAVFLKEGEVVESETSKNGVYAGTYFNTTVFSVDNAQDNILDLAEHLQGTHGQCTEVMFMFYNNLYNRVVKTVQFDWIDEEDALPGDLVYYENMSGWSHVAVYLGEGKALHGNIQGVAQILDVHLPFGSEPNFARPIID